MKRSNQMQERNRVYLGNGFAEWQNEGKKRQGEKRVKKFCDWEIFHFSGL